MHRSSDGNGDLELDQTDIRGDNPEHASPQSKLLNAESILVNVREDLKILKGKYSRDQMLDGIESFGQYYDSMKKLFDEISVLVKSKTTDFALVNKTNDLMTKSYMLNRKVIALESEKPETKQNKEILEHCKMRISDIPTTRKTLKAWVQGRIVDPGNLQNAKEDLITALECYIKIRSAEKHLFEGNKQDKLDAARAMLLAANGDREQSLTLKQVKALTSDDLGSIIRKFQPAVHVALYNESTNRWDLEAETYGQEAGHAPVVHQAHGGHKEKSHARHEKIDESDDDKYSRSEKRHH